MIYICKLLLILLKLFYITIVNVTFVNYCFKYSKSTFLFLNSLTQNTQS